MPASPQQCAADILGSVPATMRFIRKQMRSHPRWDISMPQLGVLAFINRSGHPTLSDVAENAGLSLPSMSRMINSLVVKGLVRRTVPSKDRRKISLTLTDKGRTCFTEARHETLNRLAEKLGGMSAEELQVLSKAMNLLHGVFDSRSADEKKEKTPKATT